MASRIPRPIVLPRHRPSLPPVEAIQAALPSAKRPAARKSRAAITVHRHASRSPVELLPAAPSARRQPGRNSRSTAHRRDILPAQLPLSATTRQLGATLQSHPDAIITTYVDFENSPPLNLSSPEFFDDDMSDVDSQDSFMLTNAVPRVNSTDNYNNAGQNFAIPWSYLPNINLDPFTKCLTNAIESTSSTIKD